MSYKILFKEVFDKRILIGSAVVVAVVGAGYMAHRKRQAQPVLTPLKKLNEEFKLQYEKAWKTFWRSETEKGSVIVGKPSSLTLFHKKNRSPICKVIPPIYHDLKCVAHIPLVIRILFNNDSSTLTNDTLEQFWQYLNDLQIPESIQSKEKVSADRILSESKKFLRKEMDKRGSVDPVILTNFCRSLTNDLSILLDAAAIAQLNQMHEVIKGWMSEYKFDPQDPSVKVLLAGPRAARENCIQTTYFERLLGDERKRNIIYIEELYEEEKIKSIFARWFLDEELSVSFYNDKDRMHRDLLTSEYVKQQIDQLIPS
ncbi:unnamed protein product [Adineta steineri]|uniref:Uncharacterized protein n=1 Tax=Adineta steineri TaxID=433720 RepID=A0A819YV50_9BILA|nr:unnamed protein product [Adineta steineri]CAF4159365.1 unnamed protein product [Adineta steineri]